VTWTSTPINSAFFKVKTAEFYNPPVTPVAQLQEHGSLPIEGRDATVRAADVSSVLAQSMHRFGHGDYQQLQRSPAFQRGFVTMDAVSRSIVSERVCM
jgi:hypothetical protein